MLKRMFLGRRTPVEHGVRASLLEPWKRVGLPSVLQHALPFGKGWDWGEAITTTSVLHVRNFLYPPDKVKFTVIWVSTSTGSPLRKYGLYFHCFTASMAAGASMGCPLIRRRFAMEPSLLISACSNTEPWMRAWRARGG